MSLKWLFLLCNCREGIIQRLKPFPKCFCPQLRCYIGSKINTDNKLLILWSFC